MSKRRSYGYWGYEGYGGNGWYGFPRYQTVASKRARAARDLASLHKKNPKASPIVIEGRTIARTFWGEAWCENLERYSDYANRLPRGRSYVCNGLVLDLQVRPGVVTALVSGRTVYTVRVAVAPLPKSRWRTVCRDVSGAIDSVIELLQGRLSDRVMARLTAEGTGLFPSPKDIRLSCTCPDWADMCKHVAAALYGIGARLDHDPALLFTLRKVKEAELVGAAGTRAAAGLATRRTKGAGARKVVDQAELGDVFGIDITPAAAAGRASQRNTVPATDGLGTAAVKRAAPKTRAKKAAARKTAATKTAKKAVKRPARKPAPKISAAERRKIVERAKRRQMRREF